MKRFIEGADRSQSVLFPERLDDWIDEDDPVRVIDAFVDELDLATLGFDGVEPAATGRPAYRPCTLLELTMGGKNPITLPNGERRTFLEDGDTLTLRGYCERKGFVRIGLGECGGTVLPAAANGA